MAPKASKMIRVDQQVYAAIVARALAGRFESPNKVLRRVLGLDKENNSGETHSR